MCLATVNAEHKPSSRMVLLKKNDEQGFCFFTNLTSRKGGELNVNKNVALCFYWGILGRQVRIEGEVESVSAKEADDYFSSRRRGSQIGAWASDQSDILVERDDLENRVVEFADKFKEHVPRPPHWGGYMLKPRLIEFWQGRPSRLHDRIVFELENNSWKVYRKNP